MTACSQSQRELQDKLAQRGLPKSGNKAELAQRLHEALAEEQDMLRHEDLALSELTRQFRESTMGPGSRSLLCPCVILTMCRKQAYNLNCHMHTHNLRRVSSAEHAP